MEPSYCYWNGSGRYQVAVDRLSALIPRYGDVKEKGAKLERFRRAVNVYYDLNNNGLCNRFGEVRTVFKITPRHFGVTPHGDVFDPKFLDAIEEAMDAFALDAAREQGIESTETVVASNVVLFPVPVAPADDTSSEREEGRACASGAPASLPGH
ncbi:hypothetical protein SAMN04488047_13715 [Tranquillimonas alkanivorans]|uniref:Uncharacterized protein n=2 Tax=Tranquillimonas alkanivorans TaxID=441119 RepID=A0A1I5VX84_9RHOB|nr:hypothetical protein SAMN04488047_13715 [Tranquillimonas alkanivorans]